MFQIASVAKKSYYYKNNVISQRSEEILTFWEQKISHFASLRWNDDAIDVSFAPYFNVISQRSEEILLL